MSDIDVYSVRDLRVHSAELLKDAENGQISLITKHGKPAILALPFDKQLLNIGVSQNLAVRLFENKLISLSKASKIASLSMEDFVELLQETGVSVVDYPAGDLDDEMKVPI